MEVLDENLNKAFDLCQNDFSHSQLINFLKNGDVAERQYAALVLECVKNKEDAEILLNNLVGVDGKIREAVSIKVAELVKTSPELFVEYGEKFVESTIDVNGNVCRQIIDVIGVLKNFDEFVRVYKKFLFKKIDEVFEENGKLTFRDRKYTVNKIMFKIYWCLEAIFVMREKFSENEIKEILLKCGKLEDYTVREKVAKILSLGVEDFDLCKLRQELREDENYYVRRY